jgi:hypothetical protein
MSRRKGFEQGLAACLTGHCVQQTPSCRQLSDGSWTSQVVVCTSQTIFDTDCGGMAEVVAHVVVMCDTQVKDMKESIGTQERALSELTNTCTAFKRHHMTVTDKFGRLDKQVWQLDEVCTELSAVHAAWLCFFF